MHRRIVQVATLVVHVTSAKVHQRTVVVIGRSLIDLFLFLPQDLIENSPSLF